MLCTLILDQSDVEPQTSTAMPALARCRTHVLPGPTGLPSRMPTGRLSRSQRVGIAHMFLRKDRRFWIA